MLPEKQLFMFKKLYYPILLRKTLNNEPDFKVLKYLVCPGDNCVDIGCNIGIYTKFLSELVRPSGKVFSIEPVPHTFELARSNIKKLKLTNVEAINCVVSNINAWVNFEIPRYRDGGENFYEARISRQHTSNSCSVRKLSIESKTLSSLFSKLPDNISFVKCDVEGFELEVIKGASEFIERHKPSWLIEICSDPDEQKSPAYNIFEIFKKEKYEAFWFDGEKLNKRKAGDKSINYFFLLPNHWHSVEALLNS